MRSPDAIRLRHMREAVASALEMADGRQRPDLTANMMLALALARGLEILGEAASKVTPEVRIRFSAIPFAKMVSISEPSNPRVLRCGPRHCLDDRCGRSPLAAACSGLGTGRNRCLMHAALAGESKSLGEQAVRTKLRPRPIPPVACPAPETPAPTDPDETHGPSQAGGRFAASGS